MKMWILVVLAALAAGASAQCSCETFKWGNCEGPPCTCSVMTNDKDKVNLDCTKLVPKCIVMKTEMYRRRNNLDTRSGGKPVETAFVDNDGIYDPECEADGKFKARQCNGTDVCWCVNSAGVRRTDKGDKNLKCEKLVETYWIRLQLTHKAGTGKVNGDNIKASLVEAMKARYNLSASLVDKVEYDPDARLIVVDVKKPTGERGTELANTAAYMEKDVKATPIFRSQDKFAPVVAGQRLEMENILVYYVDEEGPTFTMQHLTSGIIAVIVVVVLVVVAGFVALVVLRKKIDPKYKKTRTAETGTN